jgi:hypothetical protein
LFATIFSPINTEILKYALLDDYCSNLMQDLESGSQRVVSKDGEVPRARETNTSSI